MPHPLVVQLRFTRSEFERALAGLSDADAHHRFPPMAQMWESWQSVVHLAGPFLDTLTTQQLQATGMTEVDGQPPFRSTGSLLLRVIYHYWYHLGEVMAIRQRLGHTGLPEFVSDLDIQRRGLRFKYPAGNEREWGGIAPPLI
jgi:hypothetical protein